MRRFLLTLTLFAAIFAAPRAQAATIFVDLDPSVVGIQSTLNVSSPATLTVDIIYDPNVGPFAAVPFTGFGVDLQFFLTGTAGAIMPTNFIAGDAFDALDPVDNVLPNLSAAPSGTVLTNRGAAAFTLANGNIGGASVITFPSVATIDPTGPVQLASATVDVSGVAGDTVTLTPSGIFGGDGFAFGLGDALFSPEDGRAIINRELFASTTFDTAFTSATVTFATAVPEPSSFLALAMVGGVATFRRRRR